MTGRATERPFTETEAGISTGSDGLDPSGTGVRGGGATDRLLPASTASGPVALPRLMKEDKEPRHTIMTTCACGARVRVELRNPATALRHHAKQPRHQKWRAAHGFDSEGMPT